MEGKGQSRMWNGMQRASFQAKFVHHPWMSMYLAIHIIHAKNCHYLICPESCTLPYYNNFYIIILFVDLFFGWFMARVLQFIKTFESLPLTCSFLIQW